MIAKFCDKMKLEPCLLTFMKIAKQTEKIHLTDKNTFMLWLAKAETPKPIVAYAVSESWFA